jgi:Bacterial SH3 domain
MRGALAVSLTLLAWAPAGAGELIFANGSRLAGELSNEALMMSTGSGLVEIAPDEVVTLSREEIRLRDGRVIRGTLVGGQVKARTSLGEIAVTVDELQVYRGSPQAGEPGAGPGQTAASWPAASTSAPVSPAATSATPVAVSAVRSDTGIAGGLPTAAAYQEASNGRQGGGAPPVGVQTAVLTPESHLTPPGRTFEVIGESVLYRDALYSSSRVGRVVTGQQVKYLDSIDRRLRILNLLVFDGGYWVKIRLPDGTEGWVPADSVREVR